MKRYIQSYLEWHIKDRFYYLLISIALFIAIPPFTYKFWFGDISVYALLSFIIISCVLILFDNSKYSSYGIALLILALFITWFTLNPTLGEFILVVAIKQSLLLVLFVFTALKVIRTVFKQKKVNAKVIAASVGAYLLFGLAGAMLFGVVQVFYPTSFEINFNYGGGYNLVYYSFVTLSTLGYGDITPHSPQGQAAAIIVSITGQLYLAILMAMLVGKFLKDSDW